MLQLTIIADFAHHVDLRGAEPIKVSIADVALIVRVVQFFSCEYLSRGDYTISSFFKRGRVRVVFMLYIVLSVVMVEHICCSIKSEMSIQ